MDAKRRAEIRAIIKSPHDLIGDHLQYVELESLLAADEECENLRGAVRKLTDNFDKAGEEWEQCEIERDRLRAELSTAQRQLGECSGGYETLEKELAAAQSALAALRQPVLWETVTSMPHAPGSTVQWHFRAEMDAYLATLPEWRKPVTIFAYALIPDDATESASDDAPQNHEQAQAEIERCVRLETIESASGEQ